MRRRKIFISHSANHDASAMQALKAIEEKLATRAADFGVLVDHSTLQAGENWRPAINIWCGICDAALLLITPDAIRRDYCQFEWSVLSYRRETSGIPLPILPIYLGATREDIRNKPYRFTEIQDVTFETIGQAWPRIESFLDKVQDATVSNERQAHLLASLICNTMPGQWQRAIAAALEAVDLEMGTWEPLQDPVEHFCILLLGLGLEKSIPALLQLTSYYRGTRQDWLDLMNLLACAWVDYRSSRLLRTRSIGRIEERKVGLSIVRGETAGLFVIKASDLLPSRTWYATDAIDVAADFDELAHQIELSLARVLRLNTDPVNREKLSQRLQREEKARQPVIVYLRGSSLDDLSLTKLRARFESVTFLVLYGANRPALSGVEWIEPDLAADFEETFWGEYAENTSQVLDKV